MNRQYSTSSSSSRPRLPEVRPHTVHAASSRYEPSIVAGTMEAASAFLVRDDTDRDMTEFAAQTIPSNGFGRRQGSVCETSPPYFQQPASPYTQVDSSHSETYSETSSCRPSEASSSSTNPIKQAYSSLGRRFSKTVREKADQLRMRRTSTVADAGPSAEPSTSSTTASTTNTTTYPPPPLSPSKRSAKSQDPNVTRERKRGLFSGASAADRKDTPAPAPQHNPAPAARPLLRSGAAGWTHVGGEGARASAAAYRREPTGLFVLPQQQQQQHSSLASAVQYQPLHQQQTSQSLSSPLFIQDTAFANLNTSFDETERRQQRLRLGSHSSAADSGTDVRMNGEDTLSCKDSSQGDAEYLNEDIEMAESSEPRKVDFVESGRLPTEICLQIFEYLDAVDLERSKLVSREWYDYSTRTSVWRAAYLRKYDRRIYTDPAPILVGGAGLGRPNKPDQQWREMYKARLALERNWRKGPEEAGKAIYLSGHTDSVYCLQFDEEKIITGSRDRTIRVWDINTFQCLKVIGGPNVRPVAGPKVLRTVDYPSFHLATASVNGSPYGNNIYTVPHDFHDASILCLQYDDEILVTGSSDYDLLVWNVKTFEPIKRLKRHAGGVLDVALDSKHIISCSKDSRIIVWNRENLSYVGELTGHRGPVNAVQLRGKYLVSASGDGIARLWDIEAMKLIKEFSAKERGLAAVEFSEDMKYVLAGGNDHITYKFEVETGKEVLQYTGHSQLVRSLWLDSANSRVVSGSYDLDLRVYDFETGQELWRGEEWTTSWMLAAKSDYRRIVATSQDGRILVVDFGLKKGGLEDGQPLDGVGLLRGVENTNEIVFRQIRWH